jgi:hypothetical protein
MNAADYGSRLGGRDDGGECVTALGYSLAHLIIEA